VNHEVRTYAGWNSTTNMPTGPTTVYREDWANGYTETLTMSAAPHTTGGVPDGTEAIANVQSLSRSYVNAAGQVVTQDDYFNLSGLTYTTGVMGAGVNFYQTQYAYAPGGQLNKVVSAQGTITRMVYDGFGRKVSTWVGTNDTPASGYWSPTNNTSPSNMVEVESFQYDNGGVGDGNLTQVTQYPGGSAANRVTDYWYDWRDRQVAEKDGVESSETDGVNRPLIVTTYDNLNEVTETQVYVGDGVTPSIVGGVLSLPTGTSADLRAQTTTSYDELGQVYRTDTYDVNPTTGAVGSNTLYTEHWYDARGNVIETLSPGGLVTKDSYDGAGRVTVEYTTDGGGGTSYTAANYVSNDTVLEQKEFTYDANGNVIETVDRQRFDNATGTGVLGTPTSGIGARVSYMGYYYDLAGRQIASVDVGTNGGTAWTMPSTPPSSSSTALVTTTSYSTDAVQDVTLTGSPTGGTFTLSFGGDTTSAIAYNASAATVQSTLAALTSIGSGNVAVIAAPGGGWEVRFTGTLANTYQVALTADGSGLTGGTSPSMSVATISYGGDAGNAAQVTDPAGRVTRTYTDALGRTVRTVQDFTDGVVTNSSNATTGYTYNSAGMTSLTAYLTNGGVQTTGYVYGVTTGTGSGINSNDIVSATEYPDPTTGAPSTSQEETTTVDALGETLTATDRNGSVHTLTYDVLGRVVSDAVTTLGTGVDGSVRRIDTAYDSQGNAYLITSYNATSGGSIVNQVERVYNGLGQLTAEYQSHSGAVNTSTTPSVQYSYSEMSGGEDNSRLTSITYPDGYVVSFNYSSGLNDTISRLSSLSDSTGTLESYKYLGLDTVVERDHPQTNVNQTLISQTGGTGDAGDQYVGLDRFGRVVDDLWINTSTSTTTDEFQYALDLVGNRTAITNVVDSSFNQSFTYDNLDQLLTFMQGTHTQSFNYDAVGNATSVTTDGTTQTRSANAQNQYTSISGVTTPTYDSNGNMTTDETGRQFVYDAWNRLVAVKNSGGTTLETFSYDGLGRRVTQTAGGTTTDLYYSTQDQVLEEMVGGAATARYVWSPVYVNAMILRDRATGSPGTLNERLWVQQDANWNVTVLVNGSGVIVERYAYDPYGKVTIYSPDYSTVRTSSSYAMNYLFQGMRYDSTSGLYEADARWYSPTLQRWTSVDPLGLIPDVNDYRFVGNQPVDETDPSGLQPPPAIPGLPVPLQPPPAVPGLGVHLGPPSQSSPMPTGIPLGFTPVHPPVQGSPVIPSNLYPIAPAGPPPSPTHTPTTCPGEQWNHISPSTNSVGFSHPIIPPSIFRPQWDPVEGFLDNFRPAAASPLANIGRGIEEREYNFGGRYTPSEGVENQEVPWGIGNGPGGTGSWWYWSWGNLSSWARLTPGTSLLGIFGRTNVAQPGGTYGDAYLFGGGLYMIRPNRP